MSIDINQVIIQIIAFLIMLWVLKKFGWKPILNMLNERRQKIQSEFDAIAKQKDEIKALAENYQEKLDNIDAESRDKIQEGIMQGRMIAMQIQEEAQAYAREITAKTKAEMAKEIDQAKIQLNNEVVNISMAIAKKIIQETLDPSKHKKLISEFIEEAELK